MRDYFGRELKPGDRLINVNAGRYYRPRLVTVLEVKEASVRVTPGRYGSKETTLTASHRLFPVPEDYTEPADA